MTVFILKLIAMGTMLLDHFAIWFADNHVLLRNIGRLAFITYAFLMAESYCHLRDKPERLKSHVIKLLLLALVSELPHDMYGDLQWFYWKSQNVIPTLLLGFLALIGAGWWYRRFREKKLLRLAGPVVFSLAACAAAFLIRSEYDIAGVVLILLFCLYLQYADRLRFPLRLLAILLVILLYMWTYVFTRALSGPWTVPYMIRHFMTWSAGSFATALPLAFYNRKLGYHSKWFGRLYSLFYPLQFLALLAARYFILGF